MSNVNTFASRGLVVSEINGNYLLAKDEAGTKYTYVQVPKGSGSAELSYLGQPYRVLFHEEWEPEWEENQEWMTTQTNIT